MVAEDDWRLCGTSRLRGASFRWKAWYQLSHDHCMGCGATFSLSEKGDFLKEGYAIMDGYTIQGEDYSWVCRNCFDDLKEQLGWSKVSN